MSGTAPEEHQPDVNDQQPADEPDAATNLNQLAGRLSELARTLEAEDDTDAMLNDLVAAAVAQIPGVDEGSISVVLQRRDVTSQSPSSELPATVDALQAETGEGP